MFDTGFFFLDGRWETFHFHVLLLLPLHALKRIFILPTETQ